MKRKRKPKKLLKKIQKLLGFLKLPGDFEEDIRMSGHSHSSNVASKKNAVNAKKSALCSKLSKEITTAVIENGDNPDYNYKLRSLLEKAKKEGMKKDTIEKAIKNGKK